MPKYSFTFWEESKWAIVFEADSPEHAKKLLAEAEYSDGVDELPEVQRFFKKGNEIWDTDTLTEVE